jgi:hypothetical protein
MFHYFLNYTNDNTNTNINTNSNNNLSSSNENNSNSSLNSSENNTNTKRKHSDVELKEISTPRSKVKKVDKEKTIIWVRVSSLIQDNNMSCDQQLKECNEYISKNKCNYSFPTDVMSLKMVGSGYNIRTTVKNNLELLEQFLNEGYKITFVCYMPDRFLRKETESQKYLTSILQNGGSIHFVKGLNDEPIQSDKNMNEINQLLKLAESESKIKSSKMIDIHKNILEDKLIRSTTDLESITIHKFIDMFLNGEKLETIYAHFRTLVNWDENPNWRESYYQEPIEFDENLLVEDTYGDWNLIKYSSKEEEEKRFKSLVSLFNSYKINVPSIFRPKKKWTYEFIKKFRQDYIDVLSTRIQQL